ncbi:MAG: type VI secretion system lipoprotein TssJ [Gammaproteobacteria bacterium]|nr:type VI secretion system lipoprotein TssJ [Gammaproteobacteria bacterium]
MTSSGRGLRIIGITGIILLLSACASKPPEDVVLKGSIVAVEAVNPDGQGRPSPLVIKIYQLQSKDKFELADFFALFDQADATLGADMLAVEDIMMTPGEVRPYEGAIDPTTRFIGVVGAYRDINQAKWKAVIPMPERNLMKFLQRGSLNINAERLSISVSVDE